MYHYTIWQWVAFFFFYCFIGWVIESTYVSVTERHIVNRGFMRGPCLPLYGFGALTILFVCSPFRAQPGLAFLVGMAACSTLEYLTGFLMETLFKVKYWDYTGKLGNVHGRICLGTSLAWGALSLVMLYVVHDQVEGLIGRIPEQALRIAVCCAVPVALTDFAFAFKAALNLRVVLEKMTALMAQAEELKAQLSDAVMQTETGRAILVRIEAVNAERAELTSKLRFLARDLLRAHPTAYSRFFNVALTELKGRLRIRTRREED